MRNADAPATVQPSKPRSWRWPLIVVGILVAHVLFMLTVAAIAVRDPSFSVLPNYYKRALDWDKTKAAKLQGQALGWTVKIEPETRIDPRGTRQVSFAIIDSKGQPVSGAQLSVGFYHHSHANDAATVQLAETSAGHFTAALPMRYAGFYQFDLSATAGDRVFADSVTQYVQTEGSK